jgi:hypothetical protein
VSFDPTTSTVSGTYHYFESDGVAVAEAKLRAGLPVSLASALRAIGVKDPEAEANAWLRLTQGNIIEAMRSMELPVGVGSWQEMQNYLDANALALTPEGEFPPAIGNALNTADQQNLATNSIVREIDQWLQAMGAVKAMKRLVREGNGFRENGRGEARRERTPEGVHRREDFVVVLRRYGDSGDANSWVAAFRDEDGALLTHGTLAEARRQASNAPGASVRVGDLLAVVSLENANPLLINNNALWLGVVTPRGVEKARRPPPDLGGSWLSQWGVSSERFHLGFPDHRRLFHLAFPDLKNPGFPQSIGPPGGQVREGDKGLYPRHQKFREMVASFRIQL